MVPQPAEAASASAFRNQERSPYSMNKAHRMKESVTEPPHQPSLPQVLNRRDLILLMILIVVFVSNISGVQFGGPAAFIYWALGVITFFIPCALVTQWLARRFPGEGAPYLWITRIAGPKWSLISAFCIWLPGVLAVVSVIDNALIFIRYLFPNWFVTPVQQCLGIICLLGIGTALACIPLCKLKYVLEGLTVLYLSVFVLLGMAGGWWLLGGHPSALDFGAPMHWQLTGGNFAVYGVIILALLGVDIPLLMSGEVQGGPGGVRRSSNYVWWGCLLAVLVYVLGTFGVMVIVPADQAGNMTASLQAIQRIFGTPLAVGADLLLLGGTLAIAITYILIFARMLVVVAHDRRLPTLLAATTRSGVPVWGTLLQSLIVAFVTILAFVAIPTVFRAVVQPTDMATEIYTIMQADTSAIWIFSIIQLFILVLLLLHRRHLRQRRRTRDQRARRALLTVACFVGIAASGVGLWATVSASWIPTLLTTDRWSLVVCGVIVFSVLLGWLGSEMPRMHALLGEQRHLNSREIQLREELQTSYEEQQLLVDQQQVLLAEVGHLYHEQAQAAVTDAITSLPNHRAIMSYLTEALWQCERAQRTCAVVFVDLDHFKQVNDVWGHRAGDALLREVGARLRAALRLEDFVGRYGGEEFAVVLTDMDIVRARAATERLRQAIAAEPCTWIVEETNTLVSVPVTGSFGIAVYGVHGITREQLIEQADKAMYRAKQSGRNCIFIAEGRFGTLSTHEPFAHEQDTIEYEQKAPIVDIQVVQALTAAALAHDRDINAHAQRLILFAEETARALNLPEKDMPLLHLAALLHDIGKIGIPAALLHKPGPLTAEEWNLIRQHPEIGRQILHQIGGVFQELAPLIVAHHERWDGQGYPSRVAGGNIPLGARILAVVDAFDAMTSNRAYREPFSTEEARAELLRCSGSQFDPQVITAFLEVIDKHELLQRQASLSGASAP